MADMAHDLVIRGGHVADGRGGEPVAADVAVDGAMITAVGTVGGRGRRGDRRGGAAGHARLRRHPHALRRPGHVGLVPAPSSWHGVTTAVMGNCGVGFAPVRPDAHDQLISLMEGVEDIPGAVLHEGIEWTWESFGEYLDAVERRPHDIDLCAQLPHGALRLYVMGDRAARLEDATQDDAAAMRATGGRSDAGRRGGVHDVADAEPQDGDAVTRRRRCGPGSTSSRRSPRAWPTRGTG